MTFHEQILGFATSQNWLALGINLILSTIIGGIVIIILLAIAGRAFGEQLKLPNAFLMVLLINVINFFGILGFLASTVPLLALFLPIVIWIGFTKAFFSDMVWWHAVVVGMVGYALSIFVIPNLVGYFGGFLPAVPSF